MDGTQFSTYMAALGESFDSESYWVSIPLRHLLLRAPLEVTRSCIKQWKFAFEHSPIQPFAINVVRGGPEMGYGCCGPLVFS